MFHLYDVVVVIGEGNCLILACQRTPFSYDRFVNESEIATEDDGSAVSLK